MTIDSLLWVDLLAAAALAVWVGLRYPKLGPRSIGSALVGFLAGLCAPSVGLWLLPLVLELPYGSQLVLLIVVLPALFVMLLTTVWLLRACATVFGGPRGGHRVPKLSRSHT